VQTTLYERVGGAEWFVALVSRFYAGVEADPVLRPLYPSDLRESQAHLALFLAQYFGGPRLYDELRGHPRLRMRHAPFHINRAARDAWLAAMSNALEHERDNLSVEQVQELREYFDMAAHQMRNV
jgi:hemoglobin